MMTPTQRVTVVDLRHGRIRIAIREKQHFPANRARVRVRLRGRELSRVGWDPRFGPDRERSGVLGVGVVIRGLVDPDERLTVELLDDVLVIE
jgi:hypothetical protein